MSHGGTHLSEILTKYLHDSIFCIHNFCTILHTKYSFQLFWSFVLAGSSYLWWQWVLSTNHAPKWIWPHCTTPPSFNYLVYSQQRPFLALGRIFLRHQFGVQKNTKFNLKICRMTFLSSSHKYKNSGKFFVHNKFYHNKLILIIFILWMYILKIT
jgi:hypothetical protein